MAEGSRTPSSFHFVTLLGSECFEVRSWRPGTEQGGYFPKDQVGCLPIPFCLREEHALPAPLSLGTPLVLLSGLRLLSTLRPGEVPPPRDLGPVPIFLTQEQGEAIPPPLLQPHHFQSPAHLLQ